MTITRLKVVRAGAAVAVAAAVVLAGSPAFAANQPATAYIRAAHFSPTTPGVDVYLTPFSGATTKAWLTGVRYGTVSPYQTLPAGTYTVSMRLAGAPASSPPALSWELVAKAGSAYTVAGVGSGKAVHGVVIRDRLAAPPSGDGSVRVIQAASRAPVVSVAAARGPVIAKAAQFSTVTRYDTVRAGDRRITASSTSNPHVTSSAALDLRSGQVKSVLVLDNRGKGITVRVLLDSAADGVAPVGSVDAGAGGTARAVTSSPSGGFDWTLAGLALLPLAGLVLVGFALTRRSTGPGSRHASA
jgi:hypothetical protein